MYVISLWWSTMQQSRMILWVCFYWDGKVLKMYVEGNTCFTAVCAVCSHLYMGTPHFIALWFIVLCRYYIILQIQGMCNPESSKSISAIFPVAFSHFVSLCHRLVILAIFQVFDYFFIFVVVINELWCYCCKKIDLLKPQMIVNIYLTIKHSLFFFWPHHKAGGILVSGPGIETVLPAVEAQSLNHWATRLIFLN